MSRPEGVWKTHKESCDAQDATMSKASERLRAIAKQRVNNEAYFRFGGERLEKESAMLYALAELVEAVKDHLDMGVTNTDSPLYKALAKVEQECE